MRQPPNGSCPRPSKLPSPSCMGLSYMMLARCSFFTASLDKAVSDLDQPSPPSFFSSLWPGRVLRVWRRGDVRRAQVSDLQSCIFFFKKKGKNGSAGHHLFFQPSPLPPLHPPCLSIMSRWRIEALALSMHLFFFLFFVFSEVSCVLGVGWGVKGRGWYRKSLIWARTQDVVDVID